MQEFATWSYLLTDVGATAFTLIIVQYIKPLKWLQVVDTRLIVFIIANILLQSAAAVLHLPLNDRLLLIINSIVVSLSAMGAYSETFKKSDDAKKLSGESK